MPHTFEILEHTADIGFRVSGTTAEEMFENAALALESVAYEWEDAAESAVYPLAVTGEDYESLLVNWLSEVLYYLDARRVLIRRFRVDRLTPESVTGQGWGEPLDAARHRAKAMVKGVTYHQLKIERAGDVWRATVFLDI
jgi:SHS2 domain-containing protein